MIISLKAKEALQEWQKGQSEQVSLAFAEIFYAIEAMHKEQRSQDEALKNLTLRLAKIERDHYRKPIGGG